jgi:chitin disaccharide deacetylase
MVRGGVWLMTDEAGCILIINADDYGITAKVNRGIEYAHARGMLSSTSVMTNQAASEEAADLKHRYPRLGVGLHITFTLGAPLVDARHVPSLVDAEGQFFDRLAFLGLLRAGRVNPTEMSAECAAQLERLRALGVEPDHWNVHQHLQEWPTVAKAVAKTMTQCGVRVTRSSHRLNVQSGFGVDRLLAHHREAKREPTRASIAALHRMPDALLDLAPVRWKESVGRLPRVATVEALCHPGEAADEQLERLTPDLVGERAVELTALLDPQLREALSTHKIRVSTFAETFGGSAEIP